MGGQPPHILVDEDFGARLLYNPHIVIEQCAASILETSLRADGRERLARATAHKQVYTGIVASVEKTNVEVVVVVREVVIGEVCLLYKVNLALF